MALYHAIRSGIVHCYNDVRAGAAHYGRVMARYLRHDLIRLPQLLEKIRQLLDIFQSEYFLLFVGDMISFSL